MNLLSRACIGLLTVSSALAFVGCGDDDGDAPAGSAGAPAGSAGAPAGSAGGAPADSGGAPGQGGQPGSAGQGGVVASGEAQCEVLGELCHAADTGSGAAHECHELGHVADGDACIEGFAGCVEACVDGSAGQEPLCAALGELCHAVDDEDGPLHECHELGHVNDRAVCASEFDRCAELCLVAREGLEHGAGGAGGAGHGEGGAGHGEGGAGHGGAGHGGAG